MGTLYNPDRHKVDDAGLIHAFVEEFSFGMLITSAGGIRVSHIPLLLERDHGPQGRLLGHLARGNPQLRVMDGKQEAVVVFRGPHHYISPAWYEAKLAVPTWNFQAVHATGRPSVVEDAATFRQFLNRLVEREESYEGSGWDVNTLPEDYRTRMQSGTVMFEMPVDRFEAKFKLGAERSPADREGIVSGLRSAKAERTLAEITVEWFRERFK